MRPRTRPHSNLRFAPLQVENLRCFSEQLRKKVGTWGVFLRVGVYNGGKLLHSLLETPVQTCDEACNPQWGTWLQTDLPVCHTPRAARICFTLYARLLGKKDGGDTPLAWVSMQLFNHKDQLVRSPAHTDSSPHNPAAPLHGLGCLPSSPASSCMRRIPPAACVRSWQVTGAHCQRMWPDAEANPIGCNMENLSVYGSDPPVLFVEFDSYVLPVVMPSQGFDHISSRIKTVSERARQLPRDLSIVTPHPSHAMTRSR